MRKLNVGAAALNQTPKDWKGNAANILAAIREGRRTNVELLVLPELCITGYGCEDLYFHTWLAKRAMQMLFTLAKETAGIAVTLGLPVLYKRKLYNCVALVVDTRIVGLYAKQNLAGDGIHYEPRWFKPWKPGVVSSIMLTDGQTEISVPIGDLTFEVNGVKIGMEICEDAWVADRPGRALSSRAVDVIVNPSASHFAFGKYEVRTKFVEEAARAFNVVYVYANLLGNEAGRAIYDGDCLIGTLGAVVARSKRFSFKPWTITTAVVDIDAVRMGALRTASFAPDLAVDNNCLTAGWNAEVCNAALTRKVADEAWEHAEPFAKKCEEFTRAVALGLWDYMRKSRMHGFCVSLSGGADSGGTCVLVDSMFKLVRHELGVEGFFRALSYIDGLTEENYRSRMLQTVYLPTANSGAATLNSARVIAEMCGAKFGVENVDAIYDANRTAVEHYVGRALDWTTDDIALQNLGARSRPTIPWAIANVMRLLFLNTSNRSEAAVGYCTMDGDTSGAVNPIGGIDKAFLLEWLRWMEHSGPEGLCPLPQLAELNALAPTAELRPPENDQTDEKDLMPYPVLNRIEQLFAVQGMTPAEILSVLIDEFDQYSSVMLKGWIRKFFNLCPRAQWKRERLALSFHLDDHNLDPRTWFRFPILTACFDEELVEMDRAA